MKQSTIFTLPVFHQTPHIGCSKTCTGVYRFGFNGQEKDDEVSGAGNSYSSEYREYDSRLGRWFSIDPLFKNYTWQSPYAAFDNNPILIKDPKGLAGENSNDNGERRKNRIYRKIDKLKKRNADNLKGKNEIESYAFLKAKYPSRFKRWESISERSSSTGWDVKEETEKEKVIVAKKRLQLSLGVYSKVVDIGKSKAIFQLTYEMLGYANKIDILNEETGEVLYSTGYVLNKDGSGATFELDLGASTKIRIVANDGIREDLGFKFKLIMFNINKDPNGKITDHNVYR